MEEEEKTTRSQTYRWLSNSFLFCDFSLELRLITMHRGQKERKGRNGKPQNLSFECSLPVFFAERGVSRVSEEEKNSRSKKERRANLQLKLPFSLVSSQAPELESPIRHASNDADLSPSLQQRGIEIGHAKSSMGIAQASDDYFFESSRRRRRRRLGRKPPLLLLLSPPASPPWPSPPPSPSRPFHHSLPPPKPASKA